MVAKRTSEPSAESLARAQRRQVAADEGAKALAESGQRAAAIRKNMERLRALRLAKQAEDAKAGADAAAAPVPKRRKKIVR
ncbi:transcriptional regulator [Bradyrhizobium ontarionense]|uniref:Transcriptional regulator n=1 Tax=Bradyrhizobium ontarionense TaxID=2898149 RepID=A0ABY3R617_9BRAD|nr:transcriptional regulator [Bradyrhizobium sp. A19]UFZ02459.1 transcriptional regulator [Bradyrhizobium sp. A19]